MTWANFLRLAFILDRRLVRAVVELVFRLVIFVVHRNGRLYVPGFGVFVRNDRPARRVVVPGGRSADLPATWSIGFRAGKSARGKQ